LLIFAAAAAPVFVVLQSQSSPTLSTQTEKIFVLPRKPIFFICWLQAISAIFAVILEVKAKNIFEKLFNFIELYVQV
jgi:hypothetical protein